MMSSVHIHSWRSRLVWVVLFGVAMGYFEAALVVYLRELYYPEGFGFPLRTMPVRLIAVEVGREAASVLMLVSVAALCARRFWERFSWFLIMFGVWDILYYVFLKCFLGWPTGLGDWDILFLIPLPWVGPWSAPVIIAVLMTVFGIIATHRFAHGGSPHPDSVAWLFAVAATLLVLYSFMHDTGAGLHQAIPQPYPWGMLAAGAGLYCEAFVRFMGSSR